MSTSGHDTRLFPYPTNSPARTEFRWTGADISERDQIALNVGAHQTSRLNDMPCDTLDIPQDREHMRTQLAEAWGITSPTDARQTVGRLLDGMHSATYEVTFPLVSAIVNGTDGHSVEAHHEFLALRAYGRGESVHMWISSYDAIHQLRTVAKPFSGFTSPSWPTHIRAWDLARLPYVVRVARHVGYLDDEESWVMLHANLAIARSYYPNWRRFGQGVILGRMYWRALSDVTAAKAFGQEAANAVNALLVRPDSPWRRHPLGSEESSAT